MLKNLLRKAKFSEKEADIYIALLKLGSVRVRAIAEETGIKRATTYVVLEMLSSRGLIKTTEKDGVKLYGLLPSKKLIGYFEDIAKQYRRCADEVRRASAES